MLGQLLALSIYVSILKNTLITLEAASQPLWPQANDKMRAWGNSGLQFRVNGFKVRDKVRVGVRVSVHVFYFFVTLAARRSPHPCRPAFYP